MQQNKIFLKKYTENSILFILVVYNSIVRQTDKGEIFMATYYEKEELLEVKNVQKARYEYIDKQRKYVVDTVNKEVGKSLKRNKSKGSVPVDYMDDALLKELLIKGYNVEHKCGRFFGKFIEVWNISWDFSKQDD